MQYEVQVAESGVYDIHVRAASGVSGGRLHFEMDGSNITPTTFAPPTGGWQNWQTIIVPDVILNSNDKKLRFYVDQAGYNVLGEVVFYKNIDRVLNLAEVIDLSDFANGTYWVRIQLADGASVVRQMVRVGDE